jgi:hypothetical protein
VNISRIPERERNGEGARNEADISKVCIRNREIKYEQKTDRKNIKIKSTRQESIQT